MRRAPANTTAALPVPDRHKQRSIVTGTRTATRKSSRAAGANIAAIRYYFSEKSEVQPLRLPAGKDGAIHRPRAFALGHLRAGHGQRPSLCAQLGRQGAVRMQGKT